MHNVLLCQSQKRSNLVISYYIIFYLSSLIHSLSFLTLFFSVQDASYFVFHQLTMQYRSILFALEKSPPSFNINCTK